jgi:hypothetical protein
VKARQAGTSVGLRAIVAVALLSGLAGCGGGSDATGAAQNPSSVATTTVLWHFDVVTGDVSCRSLASADLDATLWAGVTVVPGRFGNALEFDPSTQSHASVTPPQYVFSCALSQVDANHPRISLALWIEPDDVDPAATYHLFGSGSEAGRIDPATGAISYETQSVHLQIVGGKVWFLPTPHAVGAAPVAIVESNSSIVAGAWHHEAITCGATSGDARIYLDGTVDASASAPGYGINAILHPLYIGGRPATPAPAWTFPGAIDELEMSNSILEQADIQQAMAGP